MQMLGTHPEWEEGIKKFKETEPEKFKDSIRNFNTNSPRESLLLKLSQGKSLGYYDWM